VRPQVCQGWRWHAGQSDAALRGLQHEGESMKRNTWATQGRCVIAALKRKPHTYAQMLALNVGLSPWKRVMETLREPEEQLIRAKGKDGLVRWRVIAATKWTA
jgi:hypothetical protein